MDKEQQKKLLIETMEADEKDGLYKTNNMAQQTAVEWYTDELLGIKLEFAMGVIAESEYHTKRRKAFEQAKQIEKEQSKQDYDAGLFDGTMDDVKDRLYKNAEQYYNETYGK
jgi:hypothetical protein